MPTQPVPGFEQETGIHHITAILNEPVLSAVEGVKDRVSKLEFVSDLGHRISTRYKGVQRRPKHFVAI